LKQKIKWRYAADEDPFPLTGHWLRFSHIFRIMSLKIQLTSKCTLTVLYRCFRFAVTSSPVLTHAERSTSLWTVTVCLHAFVIILTPDCKRTIASLTSVACYRTPPFTKQPYSTGIFDRRLENCGAMASFYYVLSRIRRKVIRKLNSSIMLRYKGRPAYKNYTDHCGLLINRKWNILIIVGPMHSPYISVLWTFGLANGRSRSIRKFNSQ
jgi:hypothetical protein